MVVPDGTVISSRGRRFVGFVLTIVLIIATLIIGYAIWTMVLWSRGQTPAKQLMGMRVMVAESGQTARWGQMALRGFVIDTLIPFVPFLGWIFSVVSAGWIFGNDEHRRLTDYMAGTIVVDDPQNRYG